ncbi:hypothetical protein PFISCL1PPCAC_6674 [Pristionchus fissidentatus]|uniref:Uncharacterized protein n=1 Tax=Pristionchus fissidentatus TaxID=1538716 RepID=A0AAV5V998_9BILA|nr:hypothetical protein PFISCL1PPCAC_6674 [Pristionchus fissidentatus]
MAFSSIMSKKRSNGGKRGKIEVKNEVIDLCDSGELENAKNEIERLRKLFKGACSRAREAELRAEEAEQRLDSKPIVSVDVQRENIELHVKVGELTRENERLMKDKEERSLQSAGRDPVELPYSDTDVSESQQQTTIDNLTEQVKRLKASLKDLRTLNQALQSKIGGSVAPQPPPPPQHVHQCVPLPGWAPPEVYDTLIQERDNLFMQLNTAMEVADRNYKRSEQLEMAINEKLVELNWYRDSNQASQLHVGVLQNRVFELQANVDLRMMEEARLRMEKEKSITELKNSLTVSRANCEKIVNEKKKIKEESEKKIEALMRENKELQKKKNRKHEEAEHISHHRRNLLKENAGLHKQLAEYKRMNQQWQSHCNRIPGGRDMSSPIASMPRASGSHKIVGLCESQNPPTYDDVATVLTPEHTVAPSTPQYMHGKTDSLICDNIYAASWL